MIQRIDVLDHGFVELIDVMGNDQSILESARVSTQSDSSTPDRDRTLMRYLMRHQHTSPFEQVELKFNCKLPIFVARQWVR